MRVLLPMVGLGDHASSSAGVRHIIQRIHSRSASSLAAIDGRSTISRIAIRQLAYLATLRRAWLALALLWLTWCSSFCADARRLTRIISWCVGADGTKCLMPIATALGISRCAASSFVVFWWDCESACRALHDACPSRSTEARAVEEKLSVLVIQSRQGSAQRGEK